MKKQNTKEANNVELNNKEERLSKKDEFDIILEKIRKMSEAVELHSNVVKAVSEKEVDYNYLKYVENSLEDKFFCDTKFDKIRAKILLEVICPDLANIQNFEIDKLEIQNIGSHFEEQENYIDKICIYDNKFINLFGINENNPEKVIKYQIKKFTRTDMIEAIKVQYQSEIKVDIYQYEEYYVCIEENRVKVYSEKKITSLMNVEETIFDKIKSKLTNFFTKSIFTKKSYLPNLELMYDTNPNRYKDLKNTSKFDAKARMKVLLNKEREVTRSTN